MSIKNIVLDELSATEDDATGKEYEEPQLYVPRLAIPAWQTAPSVERCPSAHRSGLIVGHIRALERQFGDERLTQ